MAGNQLSKDALIVASISRWGKALKSDRLLDREVKDVRRTAAVAATLEKLEEKLHWQKRQRALEDKRSQLRRRIFDRQRSRLIGELEGRLSRHERMTPVFLLEWELE